MNGKPWSNGLEEEKSIRYWLTTRVGKTKPIQTQQVPDENHFFMGISTILLSQGQGQALPSTGSKPMALSANRRGMVVFLISVAGEADITGRDFPCVGCMAGRAFEPRMFPFLVLSSELRMTGLAVHDGLDFLFPEMAHAAAR